jgi:hypothetical protein
MFHDALSASFENVLVSHGDYRLDDRALTWTTVEEWSKKLVETQGDVARLNGGWEYLWGKNEVHTQKVFLIRVGSAVFGYVEVANARRPDGKGWPNGTISLKDLKFLHRDVYDKFEQSELPALLALLKAPKGLEDSKIEPALVLNDGLDLV